MRTPYDRQPECKGTGKHRDPTGDKAAYEVDKSNRETEKSDARDDSLEWRLAGSL